MSLSEQTKKNLIQATVIVALTLTILGCLTSPAYPPALSVIVGAPCVIVLAGIGLYSIKAISDSAKRRGAPETRAAAEAAKPHAEVEQLRSLVVRLESALAALDHSRDDVPAGHIPVTIVRNEKLHGIEIHGVTGDVADALLDDLGPSGWRWSRTNSCLYLKLAAPGNSNKQTPAPTPAPVH
jgi:hypothetical protein